MHKLTVSLVTGLHLELTGDLEAFVTSLRSNKGFYHTRELAFTKRTMWVNADHVVSVEELEYTQ